MNYATIKKCDISNGPGVRVSLFVSGCRNYCKGCFNSEAWDFDYGNRFDELARDEIYKELRKPYIVGTSILGGEPLDERNAFDVYCLIVSLKGEFPDKTIWLYSGYAYEEILSKGILYRTVLKMADVLVDGRYEEGKRNISLQFRGSENQRIIDLSRTREVGEIVLWEDETRESINAGRKVRN